MTVPTDHTAIERTPTERTPTERTTADRHTTGPPRPKVVLQAHATRSLTALALLLHGRERGPRDMRKPFGTLLASLVIAVIIVVAVAVGGRVGAMIGQQ